MDEIKDRELLADARMLAEEFRKVATNPAQLRNRQGPWTERRRLRSLASRRKAMPRPTMPVIEPGAAVDEAGWREIVRLYFDELLPLEEIADRHNVSASTVWLIADGNWKGRPAIRHKKGGLKPSNEPT